MTKKLVIFDLDGTLAESKEAVDEEMVALLVGLLAVVRIAVISGGDWPQFESQLLSKFLPNTDLQRLTLLPTSGTKMYSFQREWVKQYSDDLTADERFQTLAALDTALERSGFALERTWGPTVEDRGTQITYSALGQHAPIEAKQAWDPDYVKRRRVKALLDPMLPDMSVRIGGATSVDITKPGIDKAYGIRKLATLLHIDKRDMLFLGDALFPGGNDAPVRDSGVASIQVRDPSETKRVIETVLAWASTATE